MNQCISESVEKSSSFYNDCPESIVMVLCWIAAETDPRREEIVELSHNFSFLRTQKGIIVASKYYSWTTDVKWTILTMTLLHFWALNVVVPLLSIEGQKALWFHQKYLSLCSENERRFGTTWGWVINDRTFILGWTIPLNWNMDTDSFLSKSVFLSTWMHPPYTSCPRLTCDSKASLSFPWAFGIKIEDASVAALIPVADPFDGDGTGISWWRS